MENITATPRILIPFIVEGYKGFCKELDTLVQKRLRTNGDIILKDYIKNNRQYVDNFCKSNNIDQLILGQQDIDVRCQVGNSIITKDIQSKTLVKAEVDKELKVLSINTITISNQIENNCKWLKFLNRPRNKQWVKKRTDKLISSGKLSEEVIKELSSACEFVIENYIDSNQLRPDIEQYWDLIDYPMSHQAEQELLKLSGNY